MDGTRRPVSAAVARKRPGTGLWPLDGAARAAFRPLEPGDGPTQGFPGPFPEPDRRAALCRRRGEGTTRRVLAVSRRQLLAGDYHRTAAGVDRTPPTDSAALPAVPSRWPRQCGRFSRATAEHQPIGVREAIVDREPSPPAGNPHRPPTPVGSEAVAAARGVRIKTVVAHTPGRSAATTTIVR